MINRFFYYFWIVLFFGWFTLSFLDSFSTNGDPEKGFYGKILDILENNVEKYGEKIGKKYEKNK